MLSGCKNRRMEILHIYSIWLYLCFQTEGISLIVNMSVFTLFVLYKISCTQGQSEVTSIAIPVSLLYAVAMSLRLPLE